MSHKTLFVVLLVFLTSPLFSLSVDIRTFDHDGFTRVVFEGNRGFKYNYNPAARNVIEVELKERADVKRPVKNFRQSRLVDRVEHRLKRKHSVFSVHLKSDFVLKRNFVLNQPFRVVFDLVKTAASNVPKPQFVPRAHTIEQPPVDVDTGAQPRADTGAEARPGQTNAPQEVVPNLDDILPQPDKLKKRPPIETICIDAGHGGSDFGAVGRSKLLEKEITLKIARKLKDLIIAKLGLTVVMTREKDVEVSLNSRAAKANNWKAQMFVSIHVNSSYRKSARGPETFYVSLEATDREAFQLSQKENGSFAADINQLASNDDLKMILWDMAQNQYIKDSSKLADYIQDELNILMHTRNRGVKQAPFRVLMRAAMPAVLVEIAFISNSSEEKKLKNNEFLNQVVSSIYSGISRYIRYHNNSR